ncbi:MAG: glycosyltransferase family 39 protein [Chloroflexi bacterium]|nr:glycosyltransferase family 39 protein [Chloroflexota bacterium]
MKRFLLYLTLILLLAFALRTYQLTAVPPGLTHDEANHGREALGILDGVYLFYFPLNYGSEPLYSYTVALSMALFGKGLLALRLVNVIFGVAAIAVAALWASRAFDRQTALLAAALTAVSFWPLATSREALRAGMLPFFMATAVWFFWQIITAPPENGRQRWLAAAGFGVSVAFTLHIYLAARVAWLMFPAFLLYLALVQRPTFRRVWQPVLVGLILAGLLATPMFIYLRLHPEALTRLDMLDAPLQALRSGHLRPVFANVSSALLAFIWPGYGDQFLAYNIPGRPVFEAVTAVFFLIGLLVCLLNWRKPAYALLLIWFGVGILPSLITGATANTTRNLAALPAVYLLPAVGFMGLGGWLMGRRGQRIRPLLNGAALLWLFIAGWISSRDYFSRWANSPDVRSAYQVNLVAALSYLAEQDLAPPIVMSTVYPGPAHDSSIALVLRPHAADDLHWVDARRALLWPGGGGGYALIPSSTPPDPAFSSFLQPVDTQTLRPNDLDPSFTLYRLSPNPVDVKATAVANFGDAVRLLEGKWLDDVVMAGETAVFQTTWQVIDPTRIGPVVPPTFTPDTVFFTQVLTTEGTVLAQQDILAAPSWAWQLGDILVQIHTITVPPQTTPGPYRTIVGIYDRVSLERLPTFTANGLPGETFADVSTLTITARQTSANQ